MRWAHIVDEGGTWLHAMDARIVAQKIARNFTHVIAERFTGGHTPARERSRGPEG